VGRKHLYGINYCLMWRGKVLAQVVESTWFVWEDLGSSPMYANYVLCLFIDFNDKYEYGIGIVNLHWLECNTKYELA